MSIEIGWNLAPRLCWSWHKCSIVFQGWSRKGTALCYLNRYEEAKIAFEEGLKIEPENQQLNEGLEEAQKYLTGAYFVEVFNVINLNN